jgi:two-component system sensor histidine kinase DesK
MAVSSSRQDPPGASSDDVDLPRDPWQRFGWLMSVIWLVFLGFPLAAALTADRSWALRVTAALLVVTFAAVYVHGFVRMSRTDSWIEVAGWGWHYVAVLAVHVCAVFALIGFEGLGMLPFLVSMGMFALPMRLAFVVFGIVVALAGVGAATFGLPWSAEGEAGPWFLVAIVVLVGTVTAITRVLDQLGSQHQEIRGDLAVAADRERVARDVHDVLGHSLTVVTVKAELAERLVEADPQRARAELAEIQSLARQSLAEIRATVGGLRSVSLADQIDSARVALQGAGIAAELPDDPAVVDPRHRIVLGWALREAVTNVVRHSSASRCSIEFDSDSLSVLDDGAGLNGHREGNGLRGLRERVREAGGTVEVGPGPDGAGSAVRVVL